MICLSQKGSKLLCKLPLIWDLDLIPLMFLAVWPSVPVLAKFLLSVAHKFHIGGFHWSEALTSFPPASQLSSQKAARASYKDHHHTTPQHPSRISDRLKARCLTEIYTIQDVLDISTTRCFWTAIDVRFALVFWGDSILCVTPNYTYIPKSCIAVKIECNYLEARRAVSVWQSDRRLSYASHIQVTGCSGSL